MSGIALAQFMFIQFVLSLLWMFCFGSMTCVVTFDDVVITLLQGWAEADGIHINLRSKPLEES